MFKTSFSGTEIWGLAVVLAICLIPVVTATFLSYRSFRRGWWLAGPGGLFVILAPAMGFIFYASGALGRTETPALGAVMAMLFGSWIAAGLFLCALAVAGPKLPVLDVGEVF